MALVRPGHARPQRLRGAGDARVYPHQPPAYQQTACQAAGGRCPDDTAARRSAGAAGCGPGGAARPRHTGMAAVRGCQRCVSNILHRAGFVGIRRGLKRPAPPFSHLRGCQMTYVVTENCIRCKYMDCVEVCPVDCFYVGANMLVIHPDECIDCGVCEPECPAEAIVPDSDDKANDWLEQNRTYSALWPNITRKGTPPDDADDWKDKPGKGEMFSPEPGAS